MCQALGCKETETRRACQALRVKVAVEVELSIRNGVRSNPSAWCSSLGLTSIADQPLAILLLTTPTAHATGLEYDRRRLRSNLSPVYKRSPSVFAWSGYDGAHAPISGVDRVSFRSPDLDTTSMIGYLAHDYERALVTSCSARRRGGDRRCLRDRTWRRCRCVGGERSRRVGGSLGWFGRRC
jgi:hypothetical protein